MFFCKMMGLVWDRGLDKCLLPSIPSIFQCCSPLSLAAATPVAVGPWGTSDGDGR